MKALEQHLTVPRSARYYLLGNPDKTFRQLWIVLHGYGQLAAYFIKNFIPIVDDETLVVAPEALSRYYLGDGKSWERVGASWMTKEDRINEISDYVNYLDVLFKTLMNGRERSEVQVNLLGFSQGTSTAWRWLSKGIANPEHFVVWSGALPEEATTKDLSEFQNRGIHMYYGDQDIYFTQAQAAQRVKQLKQAVPHIQEYPFSDGHRINEAALLHLKSELTKKADIKDIG